MFRDTHRVSRRTFAAAGAAGAVVLAGCGGGDDDDDTKREADLPGAPDDAGVVAFLLTLERLQADLYGKAQDLPFFVPSDRELLGTIAAQEDEHVARLEAQLKRLGGRAPRPRALAAPLRARGDVLAAAYRLENLTAAAVLGQLDRVRDAKLLAELVSMHTVEGRHAAAVGALIGKTATPDGAFAKGQDMATIARALGQVAA